MSIKANQQKSTTPQPAQASEAVTQNDAVTLQGDQAADAREQEAVAAEPAAAEPAEATGEKCDNCDDAAVVFSKDEPKSTASPAQWCRRHTPENMRYLLQ